MIGMFYSFAAVCQAHCIHGACDTSPFECACHDGWGGEHCEQGRYNASYTYHMYRKHFPKVLRDVGNAQSTETTSLISVCLLEHYL